MDGVKCASSALCSAISARPVLAAEPRRTMFSEEGGEGTISSSSRRRESMELTRERAAVFFFGAAFRFGALTFWATALFGATAFLGATFFAAAFFGAGLRLATAFFVAFFTLFFATATTGFLVVFLGNGFFAAGLRAAAFFGVALVARRVADADAAGLRAAALLVAGAFFFVAPVFDGRPAVRLAMVMSFRNLDGLR